MVWNVAAGIIHTYRKHINVAVGELIINGLLQQVWIGTKTPLVWSKRFLSENSTELMVKIFLLTVVDPFKKLLKELFAFFNSSDLPSV